MSGKSLAALLTPEYLTANNLLIAVATLFAIAKAGGTAYFTEMAPLNAQFGAIAAPIVQELLAL